MAKGNAAYCKAYRAREAAAAAKLDIVEVKHKLSRGIRDRLLELQKLHGMTADELISNLILAGVVQIPRTPIGQDDPIFAHLERSNHKEALRNEH